MRQQHSSPSGLGCIIPPEIKNDEFYNLIIELARTQNVSTVLEIGSSAGGGSTEAFVVGLEQNPNKPRLFCMEVSQPRFEALRSRYADKPFVRCYNTSSIPLAKFPSEQLIEKFYCSQQTGLNQFPLEQILGWLNQDIEYVRGSGLDEDGIARIRGENGIDRFDMVLIDGSEFAGKAELEEVYGSKWLLLDDINTYKNYENHQRLKQDSSYELLIENRQLRNGYSIFRLREVPLTGENVGQPVHCETSARNGELKKPLIVIDGIFFQFRNTGIARVWLHLLAEWSKTSFASSLLILDRAGTAPKIPNIRYRTIQHFDMEKTEEDRRLLQQICDQEGATLFCSTYYTVPLTTPSVFMAYDMIPENTPFFDLNHPMWQVKHYGINHASAYMAISNSTALDLVRFCPSAAGKVTVAHCAVDADRFFPATSEEITMFRQRYSVNVPYVLFIGDRTGYKNGSLLFQALGRMREPMLDIVCVGGSRELEADFAAVAPGARVHILPLSDAELRAAYSGAVALAYPSIYEGFGLPILEAMACGCPVITCQNSSIPEVAGAAALYVGEFRPDEMVSALSQVQQPDVRAGLISMGYRQLKRFSWPKMADTVKSVLESVACKEIADND